MVDVDLLRFKKDGVAVVEGADVSSTLVDSWLKGARELRPIVKKKSWDELEIDCPRVVRKYNPSWMVDALDRAVEVSRMVLTQPIFERGSQVTVLPKGFQRERQLWHVDEVEAVDIDPRRRWPSFSLIVGIPLCDLLLPDRGNLGVEVGGHKRIAKLLFAKDKTEGEFAISLELLKKNFYSFPTTLRPVLLRKGQPFIMHCLTPHGLTPNNHQDRYILYFRLGSYPLPLAKWESIDAMWDGFLQ